MTRQRPATRERPRRAEQPPRRQRIGLDCDPGHDDAIAILLAARASGIQLEAITTVAGNQTVAPG